MVRRATVSHTRVGWGYVCVLTRGAMRSRIRVLQLLSYLDEQRTVLIKGRVAREINTCDELVLTELIFRNYFQDLSPAEAVALISCFVFQEKVDVEPRRTAALTTTCERVRNDMKELLQLQLDCGVTVDQDDFMRIYNPGLLEVVYEWASGTPFAEICQMTEGEEASACRRICQTHALACCSARRLDCAQHYAHGRGAQGREECRTRARQRGARRANDARVRAHSSRRLLC